MIGINLSGAEFGNGNRYGYDYIYPSFEDLKFYTDLGVEMVRLPFRWERMQPELGGDLDPAELARLIKFLDDAESLGVKVLVDLHNYGKYAGNAIGTNGVTMDDFADFWQQMAEAIGNHPALLGYDLMNEPVGLSGWASWPRVAQAAIDAIREVDTEHEIHVEGEGWASARHWQANNDDDLLLNDPANNLVYQAHIYFDNDNSGRYDESFEDEGAYLNMVMHRIRSFTEWIEENDLRGFIGEVGVPSTDPRWLAVLDDFLATVTELGIGAAYWGAGPWFGNYPLGLRDSDGEGTPQLDVLAKYFPGYQPDEGGEVGAPPTLVGENGADNFVILGDTLETGAVVTLMNFGEGDSLVLPHGSTITNVRADLVADTPSYAGKNADKVYDLVLSVEGTDGATSDIVLIDVMKEAKWSISRAEDFLADIGFLGSIDFNAPEVEETPPPADDTETTPPDTGSEGPSDTAPPALFTSGGNTADWLAAGEATDILQGRRDADTFDFSANSSGEADYVIDFWFGQGDDLHFSDTQTIVAATAGHLALDSIDGHSLANGTLYDVELVVEDSATGLQKSIFLLDVVKNQSWSADKFNDYLATLGYTDGLVFEDILV